MKFESEHGEARAWACRFHFRGINLQECWLSRLLKKKRKKSLAKFCYQELLWNSKIEYSKLSLSPSSSPPTSCLCNCEGESSALGYTLIVSSNSCNSFLT